MFFPQEEISALQAYGPLMTSIWVDTSTKRNSEFHLASLLVELLAGSVCTTWNLLPRGMSMPLGEEILTDLYISYIYIYISYCYQLSNDQIINPPQQICSSCSSLLPPASGQSDCHVQPLYMVMVFCANMGFPPLSSQELFRHSRLKWGEISPFRTQITKNDDPNSSIYRYPSKITSTNKIRGLLNPCSEPWGGFNLGGTYVRHHF